ncbi:crotonase/enoyl-CoA hydratase family protein [Frankia sp. AgB1.9]|uniref:crotonase/enoyl-CoA hydratase family protein n=1 Tax=unclassified Frankia TaxID=2632575 RepID=UPI0019324504|nr:MULTISPECIES: crotonase/enoyl-CoA hydratase family protein [unclassified Frankia]MBL7489527.1 crotonase/enoyl-CoA hydratase family protein [Frankia sp. AgW1.1]MBL7547894.1 crotonase/enoyl-CoA hydratase family protein [Frankia sp. AgB1.9]MBL7621382.1 crotonase/enoyl-CoA hydratase family protein [Frankia sp. AgB1.8]
MTTTDDRATDGSLGELTDYPVAAGKALRVQRRGPVAQVTMLGPGKGNAMGPEFFAELPVVFAALDADPSVRAVVLAGSGPNFCYGLDLASMLGDLTGTSARDGGLAGARTAMLGNIRTLQRAIDAVAECRKPVAAAVSGWCIGGGVDLLAACDVRFTSQDARFSIREVRVAIVADLGSLQRLPAIIGDGHLRELALTGKDIDAARAEEIGLVNDVLPDQAAALAAAHEFADAVAANPPLVVQGVKEILEVGRAGAVGAGLRYVSTWNAAFLPSHDLNEAVTAFVERRPAQYEGR